jgi:hypothetical protein
MFLAKRLSQQKIGRTNKALRAWYVSCFSAGGNVYPKHEARLLKEICMKRVNKLCAALVLAIVPAISWAGPIPPPNPITFVTLAGATSGGQPISASATFTFQAGDLILTLTNTETPGAIRSASQEISDITFTLGNAPGTQGALVATGQQGNIAADGTVTYVAGTPGRFIGMPPGQGAFTVSGNTITMEALGGGMPSELILPFVANGGQYPNLNSSVLNFQPATIGPATFVLDFTGITAQTTVSNVIFSFGTGSSGDNGSVPTIPLPAPGAPEPATLALLGIGALAAAAVRRRKQ